MKNPPSQEASERPLPGFDLYDVDAARLAIAMRKLLRQINESRALPGEPPLLISLDEAEAILLGLLSAGYTSGDASTTQSSTHNSKSNTQ